jgi:hypothetical protein
MYSTSNRNRLALRRSVTRGRVITSRAQGQEGGVGREGSYLLDLRPVAEDGLEGNPRELLVRELFQRG